MASGKPTTPPGRVLEMLRCERCRCAWLARGQIPGMGRRRGERCGDRRAGLECPGRLVGSRRTVRGCVLCYGCGAISAPDETVPHWCTQMCLGAREGTG